MRNISLLILALACLTNIQIAVIIIVVVVGILMKMFDSMWSATLAIGSAMNLLPGPLNLISIPVLAISTIYLRNMINEAMMDDMIRKIILIIYLVGSIVSFLVGLSLIGLALLIYSISSMIRSGKP